MPTEQLITELRADISQFRAEMRQAQAVTQDVANRLNQNFQNVNRSTQTLANSVRLIRTAFAAIGFVKLVEESVEAAKQINSLNRAFTAITGSSEDARRSLSFVRREASRLGLDFVSAAQSFQGIAAAARGTILEGEGVQQVFRAVSQASATLGLSSEQTSGALTALSQAISKGTVQAEEFRGQLSERLPVALGVAQRALGVTSEKFTELLESGQLGLDFIRRFSEQLGSEFPGDVDQATQATARLSNAWQALLARLGQFVRENPEVQRLLGLLADAIEGTTEKLGESTSTLSGAVDRVKELREEIEKLQNLSKGGGINLGAIFPFLVDPANETKLRALREELARLQDQINLQSTQESVEADIFGGSLEDLKRLQDEAIALEREVQQKKLELRRRFEKRATVTVEEQERERVRIAENTVRKKERLAKEELEDAENAARTLLRLNDKVAERNKALEEQRLVDAARIQEEIVELREKLERESNEKRIAEEQRVANEFSRLQRRTIREQERAAEERARELERFTERVEDRLADVFQRALEGNLNILDTLRDAFFATISQMAARAAAQQIIIPVTTSLFGGVPGIGGAGLASGGFLGGILGTPLNSIFGSGGGAAQSAGVGLDFGPAGAAAAGSGLTVGGALGATALGVGVGFTSNQLLGQLGLGGQAGRGLGGALGGAATGALVGGPIGAGIGALVGGLFSAFGIGGSGKKPQFILEDLQIAINETLDTIVAEATGNKRKISFETEQRIENAIELAVGTLLGGLVAEARTAAPEIQAMLVTPLNELAQEFADALEGAEFDGKDLQEQFQQFMTQELPATFAEIFGDITADIRQAAVAASLQDEIQAQIDALQDAVRTPAELFERRLDQIAALQGQLAGAGPEETTALAGQISQLVGQAFQLSGSQNVLGQDPLRLQQAQDELIQVLRDLQASIGTNLIPSFQGLQHPLTFTQPTILQAHAGETLLPAGGNASFNITINASPGMNPRDIADAVIREAERRGRFQQTTLATRRR